jgi:hypothetical protein
MRVKKVLERLDDFEYLLKELDRQRRGLLGGSVVGSPSATELRSTREQVDYAFDDLKLGLLRKYRSLRPYIRTYSRHFTFIRPGETDEQETYEVLIEGGEIDLTKIYDDLKFIRKQLAEYDPVTELDTDGQVIS